MTMAIFSRRESNQFTITINCDAGNEYDGRMGLRVSAISFLDRSWYALFLFS
jgi:hypothetical protein